MTALLDAIAGWGPGTVAGGAAVAALGLVVAAFGLGVAHGTASAVAFSGAAGALILLLAIVFEAVGRPEDA